MNTDIAREEIKQGLIVFISRLITDAVWDNTPETVAHCSQTIDKIKTLKHVLFVVDTVEIKDIIKTSQTSDTNILQVFSNWIQELSFRQTFTKLRETFGEYLGTHGINFVVLEHEPGAFFIVDDMANLDPIVAKLATGLTMVHLSNIDIEDIVKEVFDERPDIR